MFLEISFLMNEMCWTYKSLVCYQIPWVALVIVIDDIVTAIAVVDAVVSLCHASWFIWRQGILPRWLLYAVSDKNHRQEHLTFSRGRSRVVGR